MNSHIRDSVGTGVAVLIGIALGVTLAAPMLPQRLTLGIDFRGDHVTMLLVLGTVGLVAVPVGILLLYLLFSRADT